MQNHLDSARLQVKACEILTNLIGPGRGSQTSFTISGSAAVETEVEAIADVMSHCTFISVKSLHLVAVYRSPLPHFFSGVPGYSLSLILDSRHGEVA
jgi:hypothetical protein